MTSSSERESSQRTRNIDTMLDQCWANNVDSGSTLSHYQVSGVGRVNNILCFLGFYNPYHSVILMFIRRVVTILNVFKLVKLFFILLLMARPEHAVKYEVLLTVVYF